MRTGSRVGHGQMTSRVALVLTCLIFCAIGGVSSHAIAKAFRTFDVDVRVFCDQPSASSNLCAFGDFAGWSSLADFRSALEERFLELNDIYRPAQISFRLANLVYQQNAFFSQINGPGDSDPTGTQAIDFERVALLHDIAGLSPGRLTLFMLPRLGICWSPIPPVRLCSAGDNARKSCVDNSGCPGGTCELRPEYHHGLFCAAGAAQGLRDANLLAHELGHHLCLLHTHTGADPGQAGGCTAAVSHDGDALTDTPEDPAPRESR